MTDGPPSRVASPLLARNGNTNSESGDHSLREQLLALKSELKHSKAHAQSLELKLKARPNPAPFGSSVPRPTISTWAEAAYAQGETSPLRASFGHTRPRSSTGSSSSQSPISRNGFGSSGGPSVVEPPSPDQTETTTPWTISLAAGERRPSGHRSRSTSPSFGSLSRIPVATVAAGRALVDSGQPSPRNQDGDSLDESFFLLPSKPLPATNGQSGIPRRLQSPQPLSPNVVVLPSVAAASKTAGNPFFGSGNFSADRHAARISSAATGTGKVIGDLQIELATMRGTVESIKGQLRLSQRAVESLGRQVVDLNEGRERMRLENEGLSRTLGRKERMLEEALTRARHAESSLGTLQTEHKKIASETKERLREAEEADRRRIKAESEYESLRGGWASVTAGFRREADGLKRELAELRQRGAKDLQRIKQDHGALITSFEIRQDARSTVDSAIDGLKAVYSDFAALYRAQLADLSGTLKAMGVSEADSVAKANDVTLELKRLRRLMREHTAS